MKKDDFDKKLNEDDRRRISPNDVYNLMMKDRPMSFKPGGAMDIPNAPLVNYAIAHKLAQELNKDRPDLRGSDSIDMDTVTQDDIKQMMAKFAQERGADRDQEKFADIAQASRTRAFNKDQADRAQDKFAGNAEQMRRSDINKRIRQGIKDPDYSELAKDLEGLKGATDTIADLRGTMDNDIGSEFALRKAIASQGKPSEPQADGEWRGYDANKIDAERFGLDRSVLPAWSRLSPEEQQERMDASTAWRKALRANRDEITRMLNFDQRMDDEKFWRVLRHIDRDYEMPSVGEYEREQVVNAIKNTVSAVSDVIGPEAVVGYANNIVDITDAATEASTKFLDNAVKPAWQTFKKQAPEVAKDIVDAAKENDVPLVDLFTNFMDRVSRTTINLTNPLKPEITVRQEDTNNNNKTLRERAELMEDFKWTDLLNLHPRRWLKKAAQELMRNRQAAAARNTPSDMAARSARDADRNPNAPRWLGGRKRINAPTTRGQDPATLNMKDQGRNLDANIKRLSNDEPIVPSTSLEPTPRVSIELPAKYRTDAPKPSSGFVSPEEQAEIVAALRQSNPMAGVRYQDEFAATLPDQEMRDIMRNLDTPQGQQELADKYLQWQQQVRDLGIGESQIDEDLRKDALSMLGQWLMRTLKSLNNKWDDMDVRINAGDIDPQTAAKQLQADPDWQKAQNVIQAMQDNPRYQDEIATVFGQRFKGPDTIVGRGGQVPADEIDAAQAARDAALDISGGRASRRNPNLPEPIPGSMGAFEQKEEKVDEICAGGVASVAQPMGKKRKKTNEQELTEEQFDEAAGEKDACYHKVKSRYKVWPSAYASGALVKCRKVGAKNWGNKSKKK